MIYLEPFKYYEYTYQLFVVLYDIIRKDDRLFINVNSLVFSSIINYNIGTYAHFFFILHLHNQVLFSKFNHSTKMC